jgi:hypothetical protein
MASDLFWLSDQGSGIPFHNIFVDLLYKLYLRFFIGTGTFGVTGPVQIHFRVQMASPLLPPNDLTHVESSPKRPQRQRHDRRDPTGRNIIYSYSSEFLSKYVEWKKSRFELLILNLFLQHGKSIAIGPGIKRCRMIWHQWFLAGIVESETMLSRSTLAHIYDNVKSKTAGTSPSVGSTKRGPLGLHRARRARIQIRHSISCKLIRFPLGSCAVGGRRDNPEDPPETSRCLQPDQCSRGPRCCLSSPRHIGRGLSPNRRRGGGCGCPC